uniref:penicillin acylase family protein n=1 Tax=Pseudocolwellia agarivorans TaxID=1911682 RepID=UPI001589B5FA
IDEVNADPENKTPIEFIRWGIEPTRWSLVEYLAMIASLPQGRDTFEINNLKFLTEMIARYGEKQGWQIFNDVVPISDPDSPTVIAEGEDLAPTRPMPKPVFSPVQLGQKKGADLTNVRTLQSDLPSEASRCLVIGPEKSASGKVLMLQATSDGPEIHLKGGGFDNAGFVTSNIGLPIMGRGAQHGWLMVSGKSEADTVFAEKLNPNNRYEYWYKGAWKKMEHRTETIQVKDAAPVTHEVARTIHGPVIAWDVSNGVAYSEKMGLHGKQLDTWAAMAEMGRAKNLEDFKTKGVDKMGWNVGVCYGGEDGQIAYFEVGAIPKKAANVDPRLPTPGTGEYEWTGFFTPDEKPRVINPSQGYIYAWNSKPTTWMPEGNNSRFGATFRTWLGDRLASTEQPLTLLDMREFNRKIFSAFGAIDRNLASPDFFAPYISKAIEVSDDPEVKQAGELMLSFDGLYQDLNLDQKYDNPGLTLYRTWLEVAPSMIFEDDIGTWWKTIDEGRYLTYQSSLLLRAFQGRDAGAPLGVDYFNGRDRNELIVDTIKATIAKVSGEFPNKDMAEWKLPIFWKYYDPSAKTPERKSVDNNARRTRLFSQLGLGPAMAPHNGGEYWIGLMEMDSKNRALYSVVETGGQSKFIDPQGRGNPHLMDQLRMHEGSDLKRIPLEARGIISAAESTETLEYRPKKK